MPTAALRVEHLASTPLAVIRRRVSAAELSKVVPECCGLVWNAVRAQNTKAGRNVAVYLNGEIQVEVGVELQGPFVEQDGVVLSATPSGSVATVLHIGSYGGLGAAHNAVHEWSRANGRRLAGPNWEIYGHWQESWNSNPSLIQTHVHYLLAAD